MRSRLSKRAVIVIVSSQLVLVGIIGGVVVANAVNSPPRTLASTFTPATEDIVGKIFLPAPTPTTVPVSSDTPVASDVSPSNSGWGNGKVSDDYGKIIDPVLSSCNAIMTAYSAATQPIQERAGVAQAAMATFTSAHFGVELTEDEFAIFDGLRAKADALWAEWYAVKLTFGDTGHGNFGCMNGPTPVNWF
jgi:hypothetical protein